jgi:DNA-binding GntR family transcriptional regulator
MVEPEQLVVLDRLCRASYDPRDVETIKPYMRKNTELHLTIARASGNAYLAAILEELLDKMERLFNIGLSLTHRADEIVHEHSELVQAIAAGDGKSAREIAVAQIRSSQQMVLDALLSSPALLAANLVEITPRAIAPAKRSATPARPPARIGRRRR